MTPPFYSSGALTPRNESLGSPEPTTDPRISPAPLWERPSLDESLDHADQTVPPALAASFARGIRDAGVDAIVLLHGTFVGNDTLGILRRLGRVMPSIASQAADVSKTFLDSQLGDLGNYSPAFADEFQALLHPKESWGEGSRDGRTSRPIPVHRIAWSGENNHLGRADAAIELLSQWLHWDPVPGRILVWAHSHGGNVMAIVSRWLAAPVESRQRFFRLMRGYYQGSSARRDAHPKWAAVADHLCDPSAPIPELDVVTFGMPIRYRWGHTTSPLHLVHHRALDPNNPTRAVMPTGVPDLIGAVAGDYVQHLGIGGTDFTPPWFHWREWKTNRRIANEIEPGVRRRDLWQRLKAGQRMSVDGKTLLVDYPRDPAGVHRKLLGHAVYTHRLHLPFHLRMILRELYS